MCVFLLSAAASAETCCAQTVDAPTQEITFLQRHCSDCHAGDTHEGNFRLETLTNDLTGIENESRWGRIVTRLEAGEMPPPGHEVPPPSEVAKLLNWAKRQLADAARNRRSEGRVRLRRLNRREYENTIHDLLGIELPLQDMLPEDDKADGFDTAADVLAISPVHIQRYMDAADAALRAAIVRGPRPETVLQRFSYVDPKEKGFMEHGSNQPMIRPRDDEVRFFSEPHIEVPAQLQQFAAVTKAAPGRYKVRVSVFTHDPQGESLAFALRTTKSKRLLGYFDAAPDKAEVIEVEHDFAASDTVIIAPYRLNRARRARGLSQYAPKPWKEPEGLALAVQWVEVEGPLHDVWPPMGHQRLFGDLPLVPIRELPKGTIAPTGMGLTPYQLTPVCDSPDRRAIQLLTSFLARAFRRPVNDDDLAPYLAVVQDRLQQSECFETSMTAAYRAALCSPDFLFLVDEAGPLPDHALATRLSYFLQRTAPDDLLRAAADRGELRQPEVLRRETERLLADERSTAFVSDFLDQWLHLGELDATMPDRDLYPEFYEIVFSAKVDGLLRDSIARETQAFFADLLRRDASLLQLVDSEYTFLNNRLAEHYGLPKVEGVKLRRVTLPSDGVRGGIITQASVLKVTANGASTSPVVRGAFLLENIVGLPPPPPPPNAGSIEPDTRGAVTIREQLIKHQNDATCASCHRRLDPPGFSLECFDPVGQWREYYRTTETGEVLKVKNDDRPVKYRRGATVDPTGQISTGETFQGPKDFKRLLLQQPDVVARCLAAKLATFATGRKPEPGDLLVLDGIVARARSKDYGLRTLVHEIVGSELFLNK